MSHYFDEPHLYFRKNLLIVGGRNSAVEAAIRCHRLGARVRLSYRREEFDAHSIKYWLLPEINMQTNVPGVYVAGTAAAGSQTDYRLFIENCHGHVAKIAKHLTGISVPVSRINPLAIEQMPES